MKRWLSIFLNLLVLPALSSCGVGTKPSRLPDQDEVKALLVQLADEEKRAPGMVIGMIADNPQERWVIGYGELSATDGRVFGVNPLLQLAASLLIPLFVGWFIFTGSRWISRSEAGHDLYSRRPLFAEVVSTCLVLAGLFATVNLIIMRWLNLWTKPSTWDLFFPRLWGALCLGAIVGTLVAYLFHLWMLRRGVTRWGTPEPADEGTTRIAWYLQVALIVLSFAAMLAAIFLTARLV